VTLQVLSAILPPLAGIQEPAVTSPHPANHLAGQTSPYLLQHLHNPVDWYPWGDEALRRAVEEDRPIFLSIGYSACHWCHVMEHESFEDAEIAAFLNEHFVAIKVDREERPDLDELYMAAVQRMTGSGGWPMSVFLTPERLPFYGGTYFPPREKFGRPGFLDLLRGIEQAWRERREEIETAAAELGGALEVQLPAAEDAELPDPADFHADEREAVARLAARFNPEHGGFGPAPLFPRADELRWLLAAARRAGAPQAEEMALHTLRRMALGGMYDQLAGGFARYSVDDRWLVPHFEKMLYDQGTLVPAHLEAWQRSGDAFFARIARETCDFLLREMRDPAGGFWSSTDADSEGEEGKFFAWDRVQLTAALGEEDGAFAARAYGVTEAGSFEHGRSVLTRWAPLDAEEAARLEDVRARLLAARAERVPPGTDDKVLTAWNGLVIGALAQAGRVLDEPRYTKAAAGAARFLLAELRVDGRWRRSWRAGAAQHAAVLEDHAYLCRGFLELFRATGEEAWLGEAADLAQRMLDEYRDADSGVFWNNDGRDPSVLHRLAAPWDGATPAPNAVALECLALLRALTHEPRWESAAARGYAALLPAARRSPEAFAATLRPLPLVLEEPAVAVVVGTGARESLAAWRAAWNQPDAPDALTVFRAAAAPQSEHPLFAARAASDGLATLYLCRGSVCERPRTDPGSW
jgi:uncharacterized protein YyaL (SSP411 family)